VWANASGIIFFGGETLFDLLDRAFDPAETGAAQLAGLTRKLQRGDARKAHLNFPSAGSAASATCSLTVHSLPDGRPGILAVADGSGDATAAPEDISIAFDGLPIAAVILADGAIIHRNASAAALFTPEQRRSLDSLIGADTARELGERTAASGLTNLTRSIGTAFGLRDIRITARMLTPAPGRDSEMILTFEDITDRRAFEKTLLAGSPPAPAAKPLSEAEAKTFATLGESLKAEVQPQQKPVEDAKPVEAPRLDPLPAIITAKLDATSDALIITQRGKIEYANKAALRLLRFDSDGALAAANPFADVRPGHSGDLPVTAGDGALLNLSAKAISIAWRYGAAVQIVLRPAAPRPATESTKELLQAPPDVKPLIITREEPKAAAPPEKVEPDPVPPVIERNTAGDDELASILDTVADGIITLDKAGKIRNFSAGAEAIFGLRTAEVIDKPLADLLGPESRRTLRDYLSALSGPGLATVFNDGREVTAVVKQGGTVPLFLTIGRLRKPGDSGTAFCAVVRDITQWKRTEAELRDAKDSAERASRQKSEFLAKISHELRTPLNAILGFSEVMRLERFGEIRNDKYRGYVNDIHSSGSHLLSLIDDLLDLSKVEAGKLELNFTSVSLPEVVEHGFKLVQDQATSARVILRKTLPADLPNVVADLRSMRQIVLNLLSNAIKFTDPGGQVIVSAQVTPNGELKFRVKDTGLGMTDTEITEALEPFRRITTDGRDVPGTGLGLPLTKALAEANRTTFAISSEPRKGTLIEITFPTTRVLAA
jgi:PAS domain S-box-containing protein